MRIPFTPLSNASMSAFHGVLTLHVILSFVVWLTAAMCHIAQRQLALPQQRFPTPLLALAGIVLILASSLLPDFQPLPINYFPISNSPVFFLGMIIYLSAVLLTAVKSLLTPAKNLGDRLLQITMALLILAILAPSLLLSRLPMELSDQSSYELLFWASGHIYVCALGSFVATLWLQLSAKKTGRRQALTVLIAAVLPLAAALGALGYTLATDLLYQPKQYHDLFQYLMMFTSCLPVMAVLLLDLKQFLYSRLSILAAGILLLGALQGWFMTYGTLTVPAHYHAMLGLINLMLFIALFRAESRVISTPGSLLAGYGASVLTVSLSLWFLGCFGAARKVTSSYLWVFDSLQYLLFVTLAMGALLMFFTTTVLGLRLFRTIVRHEPEALGHCTKLLHSSMGR